MTFLTTILQLAAVWLAAWLMGLAVVKTLLPADLEEAYGNLIAPTVGYLTFCLLSFTISGSFKMNAATSAWLVMGFLVLAGLATQLRPAWRIKPRALARDLGLALVLMAPMALVILFPLFKFGADTYLGAVNPDYFAGLVDNYYLLGGHSVATFAPTSTDSWHPIDFTAGRISASARFGAGMFGIAATLFLGSDLRTALTLVIGFFLLSLPLTLHFFARVVLRFEPAPARWTAWLIGISAPVAMSFLYFYLGQNSGLPALPLLLAACYLMLVRPGWKTVLFAVILANAVFVNYFAMLPYALAPAGALAAYLVFTRRLSVGRAAAIALAFLVFTVALKLGNIRDTVDAMRAWMNVIGQSLQGQFFLEFLTESFFPYFVGVFNYPSSPWYMAELGIDKTRNIGAGLTLIILALLLWSAVRWARGNPDKASRVFVVSALVIYSLVWYRYSFQQQYGYAVFKMSSWLQFMVVPFVAHGAWLSLGRLRDRGAAAWKRAGAGVGLGVCLVYVALNLVACFQYSYNGAGRNQETGYIVNHFGVAGNRDFFDLPEVAKHVKANESVGMIFTDSIRHYWTSYYLKDTRLSILSHQVLPGDDENLPDVETGNVVDYYGNVRYNENEFFHGGASDQFYLTWNTKDLNQDIVNPQFGGPPVWQNDSFRLFRAADARDVLFTGRGFYRLEYFQPITTYFFPRVLRWSADGGEFYLLRPRHPGQPYRLQFDALVGFEYPNDTRTLELWIDGRKFQELTVTHSARVVSDPFIPTKDIHKLVVRVKERNKPIARDLALWNRNIPRDYRRLNVGFANVTLVTPDSKPPAAPALNDRLFFLQIHPIAVRFDGLQLDGWLSDRAQLTIPAAQGASRLEIMGFAPGNLGFKYPYTLTIRINDRQYERTIAKPGKFTVDVPVLPGEPMADITFLPGQSADLGEEKIRHKILKASLRLDVLTFRSGAAVQ